MLCFNVHSKLLLTFRFSVDLQQEENVVCDQCLNDDKKVTATYFCKTCEDPEPLCELCAKQHTRQKAFRDHSLNGNMHEFQTHHSMKRYFKYSAHSK